MDLNKNKTQHWQTHKNIFCLQHMQNLEIKANISSML
jgi:hypothetical protein